MLKQLGLTASIEQLILDYDEETPLFFSSELYNIDTALSDDASLNLYRCIQEILNNIIKHAQATSVSVKIEKVMNAIDISISDNGIGFDAKTKRNQNSLGLKTIAERIRILHGQLQIKSQPNKGTTINVQISTPS
ncbi:ATP-binding protein [Winogradskyella sp.]|uniref:sensor histidine kinase n=1 Tax=Winogradskyella sp. TaxID=1883156 RepID=UPI0025F48B54|nr:ATP-binding protein [Winogradskyella sp.]